MTSTSSNNTKLITFNISAPGKIILHGEHAVVYNKLALAASLDLRTHIEYKEIDNIDKQQIKIDFQSLSYKIEFNIDDVVGLLQKPVPLLQQQQQQHDYNCTKPEMLDHLQLLEMIKEFLKSYKLNDDKIELSLLSFFYLFYGILVTFNIEIRSFLLNIRTDLSIGAGTGSSASYLVTLTATLINLIKIKQFKLKINQQLINNIDNNLQYFNDYELNLISRWAYCAERIIHGTPSGIDNTICTYGSMIEFRKNTELKIIKFNQQLPLLLINTKIQRNTKLLVSKVEKIYKNHIKTVGKIFDAIDEISQEASIYLKKINDNSDDNDLDVYYERLMELSGINHGLLCSLGVSHPKLDEICRILNEYDLKGKLTGAGGGGYAICLLPPKYNKQKKLIQEIIKKLNSIDCETIYTNLGGVGVRIN